MYLFNIGSKKANPTAITTFLLWLKSKKKVALSTVLLFNKKECRFFSVLTC